MLAAPLRPDPHIFSRRVAERLEFLSARLAGRDFCIVLRLDPGVPVRPPRAGMLGRGGNPCVKLALRLAAGPILILVFGRRIDDARDMAGAAHHIM